MHASLSTVDHPSVVFIFFFNFAARSFCSENNNYDFSNCADESPRPVDGPASVFLGLLAVSCNFVGSLPAVESHVTRLRLALFHWFLLSLVNVIAD